MTLALQTEPEILPPTELLLHFLERVDDWCDPAEIASLAATVLRERMRQPVVSVFRYDAGADSLQLLADAPRGGSGMAVGSRLQPDGGALGTAIRSREVQRTLDAYAEPDFVRSLPGDTRSEVVIPVLRRGAVLGAIRLEYAGQNRPTAEAGPVAELLSQPLAVALEIEAARSAARAGKEGSRETRTARTLAAVADRLARTEDVAGGLQRVVAAAAELIPAGSAVALLRHRERQMLEVAAVAGDSPFPLGELIPVEGTVPGLVLTQGRPVTACPLVGPGRFCADDEGRRLHDALAVPLVFGGKTFGVVAVLNREGGRGASAEDVELLQSLASQAAAVEAIRQMGPLRQQISDASMIAEVGRAMTGTLGLDEVLGLVVQAAQLLVNAQCAAVGLRDETGESLTLVSTTGVLRESQGSSIPLQGSLMGWVVLHGEPVITPSVSEDSRGSEHEVRQGPGIVVPLESRGLILGALLVARREGAPEPRDADLDALRKLGAYAAIGIDNARLYEAQRELSTALRAQKKELERAYAELASSQERLLVSEKMAALGRVTAGIAHEINSPLGSILNCLQLASRYANEYRASANDPEVTPDDHLGIAGDLIDSLTLAEGAARRVAQFVRTIKSQTRLGEESITAFDPVGEVNNTVVLLQHELRNRDVQVKVEAEPGLRVLGDPTKFAVVVQNLLTNAIDAMAGSEGNVLVRLRSGEGSVVLEVEDHGCGIPEEIRPRIYDYLFTTKDVGQGTGLGLSMVHSIVASNFKGEVDFRSEVGVGTTFFITFPAPVQAFNHGP